MPVRSAERRRTDGVPRIDLDRGTCNSFATAIAREWLVTNGLGGYASGTVAGAASRRYHGLLVAALDPPLGRTVLVAGLDVQAEYLGSSHALSAHEYADGTVHPEGFWYADGGYLYDVADGPDGADTALRPSQIFAVSLSSVLLDTRRATAVVAICQRELLTPMGLRSLATGDPRSVGRYAGGPAERDAAYHQGTVWGWLLCPGMERGGGAARLV